jgi:hypothetical protein
VERAGLSKKGPGHYHGDLGLSCTGSGSRAIERLTPVPAQVRVAGRLARHLCQPQDIHHLGKVCCQVPPSRVDGRLGGDHPRVLSPSIQRTTDQRSG